VSEGRELTWGCIARFWRETLRSVVCIRQQANQLVSLIKLPRKKVSYHGTAPPGKNSTCGANPDPTTGRCWATGTLNTAAA
jgi:hypothetical protein